MKSVEEQYAALAAALIDNELAWRLDRMPEEKAQNPLYQALRKEAERRGLRTAHPAR